MKQGELALTIQMSKKVNGLEMGVLSDGTVYLSGRSLADLCGVKNSSISEATTDWASGAQKTKLAKWLAEQGFARDSLYTPTTIPGVAGNVTYAYQEDVCHLVLEYYALDVGNEQAKANFRRLARAGLRLFVYHAVGYDPSNAVPQAWRHFHDRLILDSAPIGFFSVFKETADFVIAAIRAGLRVDEHTVPDISVGKAWSEYWKAKGLANQHGERQRHDHNYPDYFPQATSNPQEIWVYPVQALGEFRIWMQQTYVREKFPAYLERKVAAGLLPPSAAEMMLLESTPPTPKLPPAPV